MATMALAEEPRSLFGLTLGTPIPENVILPYDDTRYSSAITMIDDETRHWIESDLDDQLIELFSSGASEDLARQPWDDFPLVYPAPAHRAPYKTRQEILDRFSEKLRNELAGYRFGVLVEPPTPNQMFDAYVAILTPQSRVIAGVAAYGHFDPCAPYVNAIAQHFQNSYSALRRLSEDNISNPERSTFIFMRSERIEIYIHCEGLRLTQLELGEQLEKELGIIMERVGESLLSFDDSGL